MLRKLTRIACLLAASILYTNIATAKPVPTPNIKPAALHAGDTVGLISSASRAFPNEQIRESIERLQALGFKVVVGQSVYQQNGYFAGSDKQRAADINQMFANPKIKGIFEVRGGWGSSRILPYLNYKLIQKHPKVFIGFSDITALLLAIHKETGLVTFHGTLGVEPWPAFTVDYMKKVLFAPNKVQFKNPVNLDTRKDIIQTENRIITITGGTASGRLLGGNLTLLTTLLGTKYQPNFKGAILFLEDTGEDYYRIDRMMEQLKEAGVLNQLSGFIFGTCYKCAVDTKGGKFDYASLTLMQILNHYIKPLKVPAYYGAMIGHQTKMFTLPEGTEVSMNADQGIITMQEAAVVN